MRSKLSQPILIVEDSPEDFEAMNRAFKRSGLANPLFRCETGDEALDYLQNRGDFSNPKASPRPGLILLDLNLPGTDGREVLKHIKAHADLKKIPVVVLTTSCDTLDIEQCYAEGANSYICKPVDLSGLIRAVRRLKDYWFEVVVLPGGM